MPPWKKLSARVKRRARPPKLFGHGSMNTRRPTFAAGKKQITRARHALEAARAAYEAAKCDVQRLDDKAEEFIQAQVKAAYM
jgi:hypothetical protein